MDWKNALLRSFLGWLSLLSVLPVPATSKVLELSDRFLEVADEGAWFVLFYAPWCGHCKKLEPVWSQVSQSLYPPVVRVAQVDCTRFPAVATQFKVKGFPTLIFMKNGETFHYHGERSREGLVDYAERMALPPIQAIGEAAIMKERLDAKQRFFLYVGENHGETWEAFNATAYEFQPHVYFYSVSLDVLKSVGGSIGDTASSSLTTPAVLVFKDDTHYVYHNNNKVPESEEEGGKGGIEEAAETLLDGSEQENGEAGTAAAANQSVTGATGAAAGSVAAAGLREWVNQERFPAFVEMTNGNFHQVMRTRKFIVMAVLEVDKIGRMTQAMTAYRSNLEAFVRKHYDTYHDKFLFGWTGSPELGNSVASTNLPVPSLIVINSTNFLHHIPDNAHLVEVLSSETLGLFLDRIVAEEIQAYGGTGLLARLMRMYYEATTAVAGMWYGNPVLTCVIFGLPFGFLSLICYSIFCADIMDAAEDDEEPNVREKED